MSSEVIQNDSVRNSRTMSAGQILLGVADGVAASPGAARASQLTLQYLVDEVFGAPDVSVEGLLTGRYLRNVQQRLTTTLSTHRSTRGASTTIVVAHIVGAELAVLNVGDSRCYVRRAAGTVRLMSHDHTQRDELFSEAGYQPNVEYASIYGALTECLVADPFEVDFQVHRSTSQLSEGDRVVLCSDGVHDTIGDSETARIIATSCTAADTVEGLRLAVLAVGVSDNFSIIAATLGPNSGRGAPQ